MPDVYDEPEVFDLPPRWQPPPIRQKLSWHKSTRSSTSPRWATTNCRFEVRQVDEGFFELTCYDYPPSKRFPKRPHWVDVFTSLGDAQRYALELLPPLEKV